MLSPNGTYSMRQSNTFYIKVQSPDEDDAGSISVVCTHLTVGLPTDDACEISLVVPVEPVEARRGWGNKCSSVSSDEHSGIRISPDTDDAKLNRVYRLLVNLTCILVNGRHG
jgi:hypothetical protein